MYNLLGRRGLANPSNVKTAHCFDNRTLQRTSSAAQGRRRYVPIVFCCDPGPCDGPAQLVKPRVPDRGSNRSLVDHRLVLISGLVSTTVNGDGTVTYHFAEERKALQSSFVGKSVEHPVVPYSEPESASSGEQVGAATVPGCFLRQRQAAPSEGGFACATVSRLWRERRRRMPQTDQLQRAAALLTAGSQLWVSCGWPRRLQQPQPRM